MKLHVKHLKSNKKSIFFLSIILLIPFLKKKKKEREKKGKNEKSFLVIKTSVFLISTQCLHHFSPLSPHCPPTLLRFYSPLPANMKIAIIRQGWGFLAYTKEGKRVLITHERSLPLSAHKHLFRESEKDKGRNYCSCTIYAKFIRAAFNT